MARLENLSNLRLFQSISADILNIQRRNSVFLFEKGYSGHGLTIFN